MKPLEGAKRFSTIPFPSLSGCPETCFLSILCLQALCTRCNEFGVHHGHSADVVDISEIAATKKEKEKATILEVKNVLLFLQARRGIFSEVIQKVNDYAENLSATISKTTKKVIEEIKLEEQNLLHRVDKARWQRLKLLERDDNELKEVIEKGSQAVAFMAADSFSELTDAEYVQMSSTLIAPMSQAVRAKEQSRHSCSDIKGPAVTFRPSNPRPGSVLGDLLDVNRGLFSVFTQQHIIKVGSQFQADVLISRGVKPHLADQDVGVTCYRNEDGRLIRVPAQVTPFDQPATTSGCSEFPTHEKIFTIECTPTTGGDYYIYPKLQGIRCSARRFTVWTEEQLLHQPLATRFATDRYSKGHIRLHDDGHTAYCFQNHVGCAVGDEAHDKGVHTGRFKLRGGTHQQRMTLGVVSLAAVGFWPNLTQDRSIVRGFSWVWEDDDVLHLELDCDKCILTATHERSGDKKNKKVNAHGFPVSFAFHASVIGQAVTILLR